MGVHVHHDNLVNKGNNFSNGYLCMHVGMALAMASYMHTKVAGVTRSSPYQAQGSGRLGHFGDYLVHIS